MAILPITGGCGEERGLHFQMTELVELLRSGRFMNDSYGGPRDQMLALGRDG
jgi:hypothetical protein